MENNKYCKNEQTRSGLLKDYEFIPAVVASTDDPLCLGRVKVSSPGVMLYSDEDKDLIPWAYPFLMMGNSSYSKMEIGAKVWLLRNMNRTDENWYIPMYEMMPAGQEFIANNHENSPEILSLRNNGATNSTITYDNSGGYNIVTGKSSLNVGESSTASISSGSSTVNISNDSISIGTKDQEVEPAVLGKQLNNLLKEMIDLIDELVKKCGTNDPYLTILPAQLSTKISSIRNKITNNELLSETVNLN